AAALLFEGKLGQEQGGACGVLIANVRRDQDTMTLLATDDEILRRAAHILVDAVLLKLPEDLGYVLETHEQVLDDLRLKLPGDPRDETRRDKRFHDDRIGRQIALLAEPGQLEVGEQRCQRITVQEPPISDS